MNSTTNSLETSTSTNPVEHVASIRLYGSGANPIILDSIPGSAIEPLTLETFGALAQRHHVLGKNLIIARVDVAINDNDLESDELPETRSFYYHAHSLNKILFRTFGKNGEYLFRLYALNPMTNTDMVGDVVYFMVYPGVPVQRLRPRSISNPGRNNILQGTAISQQVGASTDLAFAHASSAVVALQASGPTLRSIATPSGILELCENDYSALETMMATSHVPTPPHASPMTRSPNRSRHASADSAPAVRSANNLRSFEHLMEQSIGKINQIRIAEVVGPRLNDAVLLSDHLHGTHTGDRTAGTGTPSVSMPIASSSNIPPREGAVPRGQRSRALSVGATSRPPPAATATFGNRRASGGQPDSHAANGVRATRSFGDADTAEGDSPAVCKAGSGRRSSHTPRAKPDLDHSPAFQHAATESGDTHIDTPPEPNSSAMSRSPSAASDSSPARGGDFAARLRERLQSHASSIALQHSANGVSRPSASLVLLANRSPTSMPSAPYADPTQALYNSYITRSDAPDSASSSNWKIKLRPKARALASHGSSSNNINQSFSTRHLATPGDAGSQPSFMPQATVTAPEGNRYLAVGGVPHAPPSQEPGSLLSAISSGDSSAQASADRCGGEPGGRSTDMLYKMAPESNPTLNKAASPNEVACDDYGGSVGCGSVLGKSAPSRASGPQIRIGVNVSLGRNSQRSSTSMSSQSTGHTSVSPLILHAMFIGTDDDYLTMPHLRNALFQNALTPDDMVLFEISREMLLEEGIVLPELLDELGVNVPGVGADLVDEDVNALGELSLADDSPVLNPFIPPDPIVGVDGEVINPPGVDDWTNFMLDPFVVDPRRGAPLSILTPPSNSASASASTVVSPPRRSSRTGGSITLTYNGARRSSVTTSNPMTISSAFNGGGGGRRRSSLQPLHMAAAHQSISEERYSGSVWRRWRLWAAAMHRTESWESNDTLPLEQHHRIRHVVVNLAHGGTKYLIVTCVAVAALLMVGLFWSLGMTHDLQLLLIVSICVFYFGGMASLCLVDYRYIKHRRQMRNHQVGPQQHQQSGLSGGIGGSGPSMTTRTGNMPALMNRRVNNVTP